MFDGREPVVHAESSSREPRATGDADHGIPRHDDHPRPGRNVREHIDDVRAREAARSRELAADGHLVRLWRPPLHPDEWRTLGLFAADDAGQLENVLESMPLRIWRNDEVTPLEPHPNDPGRAGSGDGPRVPDHLHGRDARRHRRPGRR